MKKTLTIFSLLFLIFCLKVTAVQAACDPSNCSGCCSGGNCYTGTTMSYCGSGGSACQTCPQGENCVNQSCESQAAPTSTPTCDEADKPTCTSGEGVTCGEMCAFGGQCPTSCDYSYYAECGSGTGYVWKCYKVASTWCEDCEDGNGDRTPTPGGDDYYYCAECDAWGRCRGGPHSSPCTDECQTDADCGNVEVESCMIEGPNQVEQGNTGSYTAWAQYEGQPADQFKWWAECNIYPKNPSKQMYPNCGSITSSNSIQTITWQAPSQLPGSFCPAGSSNDRCRLFVRTICGGHIVYCAKGVIVIEPPPTPTPTSTPTPTLTPTPACTPPQGPALNTVDQSCQTSGTYVRNFSWATPAGTQPFSYRFEISEDAGYANPTPIEAGTNKQVSNVSLKTGTTYYWRVRAVNACGCYYGTEYNTGSGYSKPCTDWVAPTPTPTPIPVPTSTPIPTPTPTPIPCSWPNSCTLILFCPSSRRTSGECGLGQVCCLPAYAPTPTPTPTPAPCSLPNYCTLTLLCPSSRQTSGTCPLLQVCCRR